VSALREPDRVGLAARAWRIPPVGRHERDFHAWIIHAPSSHPLWPWHALAACQLDGIPGFPEPHRRSPDATHELAMFALNPDHYPPNVDGGKIYHLTPADIVEQFSGMSDAGMALLLDLCLAAVCDGVLGADSDWRAQWAGVLDHTLACSHDGAPVWWPAGAKRVAS
jgi:hypothetical protein